MKRIYDSLITGHTTNFDEMLFVAGPRQVGKTTSSKHLELLTKDFIYLNWDNEDHKTLLLAGPAKIFSLTNNSHRQTNLITANKPIIVFDEIHKRPDWKNFLKGFYDNYKDDCKIIVTGSTKLDLYQKGGDSLMGRYFLTRMHPISVAECLRTSISTSEISPPLQISNEIFQDLITYGGFPKPFLEKNITFSNRWQNMRFQQLLNEEIRDIGSINDINKVTILATLLKQQAGSQLKYSSIANLTKSAVNTISRWIEILEATYYCYRVKPWHQNISRALIKEPKVYLWDWSCIEDKGARAENFIASHLLKATQFWTDAGLGNYDLHYIRTKDQKEVDFLVTKNHQPWFLVEVKCSAKQPLSPHLQEFQILCGAKHAFQVALDLPYEDQDCFSYTTPVIVSAQTFLSQLI